MKLTAKEKQLKAELRETRKALKNALILLQRLQNIYGWMDVGTILYSLQDQFKAKKVKK